MDYIASLRVSDLPEPQVASRKIICVTCRELIWISDGAFNEMLSSGMIPVCVQCVRRRVQEDPVPTNFALMPGQLAEIERELGSKVARDIEKMVERLQKDAEELRREQSGVRFEQ